MKFGGTSVGSAERVRNSAAIIEAQPLPRAVVVSAVGGVTNLLLEAAACAARGDAEGQTAAVAAIRARHAEVASGIANDADRLAAIAILDQLHAALDDALAAVAAARELSARDSDRIVATGEKAMSVMMAATLRSRGTPAVHVWADRVIATDGRYGGARPNRERTRAQAAALRPGLEAGVTVVMTGFIGGAPDGSTTTLGRGGSDYSATLLGAALDATEVQIWTDVPGVLSADPRQVADARVVSQISYDEAQELAHFGAKVLHPRTIRPAVSQGVAVRILSTFAPEEPGTLVTRDGVGSHVKAVTALKNLLLLTIDVAELEDLAGASAEVFAALHHAGIEIAAVSQASSRRRMTYLVDAASKGGCVRVSALLDEALAQSEVDAEVRCEEGVALVAAVGRGVAAHPSAVARMLAVLGRAGVSVLSSSVHESNAALTAAVPARHADRAVLALHEAMIRPQSSNGHGRRPRRSVLLAESMRVG
ncbi:MAG: aspartate kinase [Thermomicrobiales bacterium]|nr:aspartate kinase [Thermomicrobiales bacterium]